ncbi:MAG: DUF1800 domain-containing protein [Thermoanaerobaculia bacterium]|nr:DUF1800 domain-containing protein [Thermoanaerobaculia bacterium]
MENVRDLTLTRRRILAAAGLSAGAAALPATALLAAQSASADGLAMRNPQDLPATEGGLPALPSAAVVTLNRCAFGPRPGDIAAFQALGPNDPARIAAWVAQQLDYNSIADPEIDSRLAAANFESYGFSTDPDTLLSTLWDWYDQGNAPGGNSSSSVPRDEMTRGTFLRAMYSKRQLHEVLADYWRDHFNVFINHSSWARITYQHLDLILRQNQMGRFRTMLEAVTRSSAMLYYLDNFTSSDDGPNENFCRELFELHALGAENYLGVLQQNQVPTDPDGKPIGYVDADVFEAARAFTGWSFAYGNGGDPDNGLYYYRPSWHDRFQKTVLGVFMPQDQADEKDGKDVLDALASHPGTGRYIARRLCTRLVSDEPPQSLIDTVAALFTAQWQAPDQLKQVYEAILLSDEFRTTWGEKIKRPFEVVAGALRAGGADFTLKREDDDTNSFLWRYDDTGHELFNWPAPNGFPDQIDAWKSMTPRVACWRICNWLIEFRDDNDNYYVDVLAQTPGNVRSANALADFWIQRVFGRAIDPDDRQEIVEFMGQGFNPDFDLNLDDEDTGLRVRSMVGLLFMSPEFLWR